MMYCTFSLVCVVVAALVCVAVTALKVLQSLL